MFWLGLILPVCFVAGITGATIPTQLPLLSIVLPFALWRDGRLTAVHWLGIAFLAYAALSLFWAVNRTDSVFGLWQVALWALAFWLGSTLPTLASLWHGLALSLSISSIVAVAQSLGWTAIPSYDHPAGLLYSGEVQSGLIALVILALVCERAWAYIPALLPGLIVAHSRGGYVVLAIGLLARVHWLLALSLLAWLGALVLTWPGESDLFRLMDWKVAFSQLTWHGGGIGSFADLLYQDPGHPIIRPGAVHNDYLQLAFELGLGAVPLYLILARALWRSDTPYWPVMVGFATMGLFYFPLYVSSLAFIGAVVAGHNLRGDDWIWPARLHRGLDLLAWHDPSRCLAGEAGGKDVSVLPQSAAAPSAGVTNVAL